MPEDNKGKEPSANPEQQKPAVEPKPADPEVKTAAEPVKPVAQASAPPAVPSKEPAAAATAQPAAPAAKPAAPAAPAAAKPAAPAKPEPWDAPIAQKLKGHYGSGITEASTYMGQNYLVVDRSIVYEVLQLLRNDEQFDYCVDITAVHYPKREKQFDVVYVLYSFARNERIRVKTQIADGESEPSAVPIWPTANWLERECFDMFGIQFEGHPDPRRILLPDGWTGYPLRKDYDILKQDTEWVKANLGIESGQ